MDLGAYRNIEDIEHILKENNIDIPRLRGIRIMEIEEKTELPDYDSVAAEAIANLIHEKRSRIPWSVRSDNSYQKKLRKYLIYPSDAEFAYTWNATGVKWNEISRLNAKKRKLIEIRIRKDYDKYTRQANMFNKYVGKPGILYVHARLGGWNWIDYDCRTVIAGQPWYLESIDDAWDDTYRDIYIKI